MTARHLFAVHLQGGELYARAIEPTDRDDHAAGRAAFFCVVLATDEVDALDLGRRLADANALRARLGNVSPNFRAGYQQALEELKAFLLEEHARNLALGPGPVTLEWIGVGAEIERLSTWAHARMSTPKES